MVLHCFFNDCHYCDCYEFWQLLIVIKVYNITVWAIRNYFCQGICIKRLLNGLRVYCWHFGAIYEEIYQKSAYYRIANLPILVKFCNILKAKLSWCQSDTVKGLASSSFQKLLLWGVRIFPENCTLDSTTSETISYMKRYFLDLKHSHNLQPSNSKYGSNAAPLPQSQAPGLIPNKCLLA